MKTITRLFLSIPLTLSPIQGNNTFYALAHGYFTLGRYTNALFSPVYSAVKQAQHAYQMDSLADAPEGIVNLFHEKCKEHGLDPQAIRIKIKADCNFIEAFGKHCIVMSPHAAQELAKALENPADETAAKAIRIYATFLDHEISHLKNNDTLKRLAFLVGASAGAFAIGSYIVNSSRAKFLFQKPTNIKEFIIALYAYGVLNMASAVSVRALYSWYAQRQETQADDYAIAHAHDPEALRQTAHCIEYFDNTIIQFLCGDNELLKFIPFTNRWMLTSMRSYLVALYEEQKPQEEYREWLKKQTVALAYLKFIYDPEHPSGFSRAQAMRAAADKLEAKI